MYLSVWLNTFLATGDTPLTGIGAAVQAVMTWLVNLFQSAVPVFWDGTNNEFTFLGYISLVLFGAGMVYGVFRFIRSMIRQ